MAVQAHQLNYFPSSHITQTRETMDMNINMNMNMNVNTPMNFGLPFYDTVFLDWVPETLQSLDTTAIKAESGVTCTNRNESESRKRSRDSLITNFYPSRKICRHSTGCVSFLGEDITLRLEQQQLEMDQLITQHMEKVRLMVVERRKEQSRRIVSAVEERIIKRMKEKEEEISKAMKLNWSLEEKLKTLFVENQMWRNLAETNEATANTLRSNLQQILSHHPLKQDVAAEDAESCCGSSDDGDVGRAEEDGSRGRWGCRKCGKEESSVVLLPCRHLCLCPLCAPTLNKCPVCNCNKNGSVHVNMGEGRGDVNRKKHSIFF